LCNSRYAILTDFAENFLDEKHHLKLDVIGVCCICLMGCLLEYVSKNG